MRKLLFLTLFFFIAALPARAESVPRETLDAQSALVNGAIVVKGEGAAPHGPFTMAQKRIMALRAAKAVAFREASELLDGLTVSGETTVLNASVESDIVRTNAEGIIKGASVVKAEYDLASGTAAVYLSVPMQGVAAALVPQISGILPEMPRYTPAMAASTAGYDGLVIDVRGLEFKPALFNRAVTKSGEAVYDPSKADQKVLTGSGLSAYTNGINEARAILSKKGSVNPLVVKASGVAGQTDAELGPIEAAAVFYSNQASKFLEAAKVVFVLD
ncbi:MAG: hypothetical protein HYV23_00935 [Deltaproteobacteria bacterium]|nr:hypothetical protein [Deltaproteobacteria bacterium]